MAKWRVIITGASGLLGRAVHKEFQRSKEWEILALGFTRLGGGLTKLDLADVEETRRVIKEFRPNVIVHSAAERRPDKVEHDKSAARNLNVNTTGLLAQIVAEMNKGNQPTDNHFILYISTDYVFDGKSPPYKPSDATNPLNEYGKQKLEGEKMIGQYCPTDGAILRVPVLYGPTTDVKESAVSVLFETVQQATKAVTIDNYQLRYPTITDDVAKVCRLICEQRMIEPSFNGIWHWSGPDCLTKYKMAKEMAEMYGLDNHMSPLDHPPPSAALRPYDTALHTGALEEKFKNKLPGKTPFKVGIKRVLDAVLT